MDDAETDAEEVRREIADTIGDDGPMSGKIPRLNLYEKCLLRAVVTILAGLFAMMIPHFGLFLRYFFKFRATCWRCSPHSAEQTGKHVYHVVYSRHMFIM